MSRQRSHIQPSEDSPVKAIPITVDIHHDIALIWHLVHRGDPPEAIDRIKCELADKVCFAFDILFAKRPRRAIPFLVRAKVMARDQFKCLRCGSEDNLTIDHVKPHATGGGNDIANLQTLCTRCNSRKGAKLE